MKNLYKFFLMAIMAISLSACESFDPPSNASANNANSAYDQMGFMPEGAYDTQGDENSLYGRNGVDLSNFDPNNISPEDILCTVYFGFDQYAIAPSERDKLRNLAQMYINNPNLNTVLIARTDWYGTEEYNILLSDKRAASVSEYLETNAVNPANMQPLSLGKEGATPNVQKNSAEANRDRRVDIIRCR